VTGRQREKELLMKIEQELRYQKMQVRMFLFYMVFVLALIGGAFLIAWGVGR
jgi:cell division septal protein FtsQ